MYDDTYGIHLEGRFLTEGRTRNADVMKCGNPYQPRELIHHWTNEISMHWAGLESTMDYQGPGHVAWSAQLRFAVTKATVAAELIHAARRKLRDNTYHTCGENFNYKARFEAALNEYVELVERIIEKLRTRAADLPKIPESMPTWRDDTKGMGLDARIRNLTYARHLAEMVRGLLYEKDYFEHPRCNDWLKLSATIERHIAAAHIDKAKSLESFRNKRIEDPSSVEWRESSRYLSNW